MRYSFTTQRTKPILSKLAKIWIFFIALNIIGVYSFGVFLTMRRHTLEVSNADLAKNNVQEQNEQANKIKSHIDRINYEINLNNENLIYNNELKNALIKLFSLIPDQITITQIQLEEKRLILKGITPSREAYAFLLQAPLQSVFATSRADFFQLPNGWYNFTSISTLNENP